MGIIVFDILISPHRKSYSQYFKGNSVLAKCRRSCNRSTGQCRCWAILTELELSVGAIQAKLKAAQAGVAKQVHSGGSNAGAGPAANTAAAAAAASSLDREHKLTEQR